MLNGEEPMPAVFRPRRSLLYLPGSNPRALEKGRDLPADGLIIDLEDAVAADAKEAARAIVAAALTAGGYGTRELVLRVNPLDTTVGPCRSRRRGDNADRRGAAAQGRERRSG
jgi:citrate lyase subunit beta/citryl-CoA lyase